MRRGFTLLEVVLALVITGLVASLGYASVQGALDTRERMTSWREREEALGTMESLVRSAVRHAVPAQVQGEPMYALTKRSGGAGSADSLVWRSRGVDTPAGSSATWRVSLWLDGDGLRFAAASDNARHTARTALVRGVASFQVQWGGRGEWHDTWVQGNTSPSAMALAIVTTDGKRYDLVSATSFPAAP